MIAVKHGGTTTLDNRALACRHCNRRKGSDISSVDPQTGQVVPLFNSRILRWTDHFVIEGWQIVAQTGEGRATIALLRLNADQQVLGRRQLLRARLYPTS